MSNTKHAQLRLKKRKKFWRKTGLMMTAVQAIASAGLVGLLFWLDMLAVRYLAAVIVFLAVVLAAAFFMQFGRAHWFGKILSLLMTVVLIFGVVYVCQAKAVLSDVSDHKTKIDVVSVYVLAEDAADTIQDAAAYSFGYHAKLDRKNTDAILNEISRCVGKSIETGEYEDLTEMAGALYSKEVQALVMNESYVSGLEEIYPDFYRDTKKIFSQSYETELQNTAEESQRNVTKEPFTIYLSGNDETGTLKQSGRSDVNILVVVNPSTRQILLVNTPRDYYVNVNSLTSGVGKDKLTHAGKFGVDASMATISSLYDGWPIDYYVRINFTGVEKIVDALGGITVDSEVAFSTTPDTSPVQYTFVKGKNQLNGKQALAFCRERNAFAEGDNQRGKDQMAVIQGVINKVTSPSILYSYSSVLASVSSLFQTSLSEAEISDLVKTTMNGGSWNIHSFAVSGTGLKGSSYFFGYSKLDVMEPDMETVKQAVHLMNRIKNGEVFDISQAE